MLYIEEIKRNPDLFGLPVDFVKILPETCQSCGSPMAVTESLSTVFCTNPNCRTYIRERFFIFFSLLGVKVSFTEIDKILKRTQYKTPLELFSHPSKSYLYDGITQERQEELMEYIEVYEEAEPWQVVSFTGRVKQGYAYKLFHDCRTEVELFGKIDTLYTNPQSIEEAEQVYNVLQGKDEIKRYYTYVEKKKA